MKKSEFDMEVKLFYTAIESNYLRELGNPIPTRITEFVTNLGEDLYNKYTEISNAISIKSEQKHRERYKEYFESIEPSEPVSIHCDLFDIWDWYGPPTEESILKSKRSKEDKKLILEKLTIYKNQK